MLLAHSGFNLRELMALNRTNLQLWISKLNHFKISMLFSNKLDSFSSDMSAGQMLSKWVEVPSHIMHNPTERDSLILHYQRGGLLPINQPATLALDSINLIVVDTEFRSQL
jgi:hypothetical protein